MGTLLRHIVDDISTDLKQIVDDKLVQSSQVAFWVTMVGNRLKSQHIGKRDTGAFLTVFDEVAVTTTSVSSKNEVKNRQFIKLPQCIYDYDKDGGIEYISYSLEKDMPGCPPAFANTTFTRTTPSLSERIYYNKYEKPSPRNPYFYRVHDHIYFLGIEKVDIQKVEIGIYTSLDPLTSVDLDKEFDFPDELIIILKRQVLDLGRFALLMPSDNVNDGTNKIDAGSVPSRKIISVNELDEDVINNK